MPDLVCYRIKETLRGTALKTFDDVVDPSEHTVTTSDPVEHLGFSAKLFVVGAPPHKPAWAGFVEAGVPDVDIPKVASVSAVLVVRVDKLKGFFAFAFGTVGRHLLRDGVHEYGYGLQAVLNLVFGGGANLQGDGTIRSADWKRFAGQTTRTRRQTTRAAAIEEFDIDQVRDILRQLAGRPHDTAAWGEVVLGGDSIKVGVDLTFPELGELCKRIESVARKTDYRKHVPWVDHVRLVREQSEREAVESAVIEILRQGDPEGVFELSRPPSSTTSESMASATTSTGPQRG